MTVQVVTGFHPAGYELYGKRMVETFDQHWPDYVSLAVYVEEPVPLPRGELRYLNDCPGWRAFYQRWHDSPTACGRADPGLPRRWKDKEKAAGYSYRFDAVKFARMAYFVEDAARLASPDTEFLVWLDGDTYTHKDVPNGWIEEMMEGADFATLFREGKHPEIGFQCYRLKSIEARQLIRSFWLIYDKDIWPELSEWHSAHVLGELAIGHRDQFPRFNVLMNTLTQDPRQDGLRIRNLAWGKKGHVWHESPLGEYTDHLKGDSRKRAGISREMRRR